MINKLEIRGIHTDANADIVKYTKRKIGKLDRYMPKSARESAHAEVFLKEVKAKNKKQNICEVVLYLPHEQITVKEATINMFAAVDIVETKLKNQIKKYKETHGTKGLHRKVLARLRRKG